MNAATVTVFCPPDPQLPQHLSTSTCTLEHARTHASRNQQKHTCDLHTWHLLHMSGLLWTQPSSACRPWTCLPVGSLTGMLATCLSDWVGVMRVVGCLTGFLGTGWVRQSLIVTVASFAGSRTLVLASAILSQPNWTPKGLDGSDQFSLGLGISLASHVLFMSPKKTKITVVLPPLMCAFDWTTERNLQGCRAFIKSELNFFFNSGFSGPLLQKCKRDTTQSPYSYWNKWEKNHCFKRQMSTSMCTSCTGLPSKIWPHWLHTCNTVLAGLPYKCTAGFVYFVVVVEYLLAILTSWVMIWLFGYLVI